MHKPVLGVDVDDVLFPFIENFIPFANNKLGVTRQLEQMTTYRLDKVYQVPYDLVIQTLQEFMETQDLLSMTPIKDSREAMADLATQFNIHIITARHSDYRKTTEDYLLKYFSGLIQDVHFCNYYACGPTLGQKVTKALICKQLAAVKLIDDNVDNVCNCSAMGLTTGVLFGQYPWHRELTAKPFAEKKRLDFLESWDQISGIFA